MSDSPHQEPEERAAAAELRAKLTPFEAARAELDGLRAQGKEVLAAKADYHSEVGLRVLLLAVAEGHLKERADLWLAPDDLARLCLGPAAPTPARCDAMYADRWSHTWCSQPDRLRLWGRRRLLLEAGQGTVRLAPGWLRQGRTLSVAGLRHIHGWLSDDWIKRGISLVPVDAAPLVIVTRREMAAALDPTYDALDLLCDASWVRQLALALGDVTGLPVELDEDL